MQFSFSAVPSRILPYQKVVKSERTAKGGNTVFVFGGAEPHPTLSPLFPKEVLPLPVAKALSATPATNRKPQYPSVMDIKNSQLAVDRWIKEHGVRYFDPLTNMALLTEETGEVARIIARRYGQQSEKESDKAKDLGEELADVVFVALCLANQTGIDLQEAFDRKMELKTRRDHDRHHNNPKLQE